MIQGSAQTLHRLAGLYGVQTSYYDLRGHRQQAEPELIVHILRWLGAAVNTLEDVPAAYRVRRQALWQRGVEPVIVGWEGMPTGCKLRLPVDEATARLGCTLRTESGEQQRWDVALAHLPTLRLATIEGQAYAIKHLAMPPGLPLGYHQLTLAMDRRYLETLLIVSPLRAYTSPDHLAAKEWGVFLPLYALHAEQSWGGGDFAMLQELAEWVGSLGGGLVGTLPVLSSFLDIPYEPSPYNPASRLFWNELYIDVRQAPGLAECPAAQTLLASRALLEERAALQALSHVDYRRQMALKRQVLECLAQWFFQYAAEQEEFQNFVTTHPALEDYARFRATTERQQQPWPAWPTSLQAGTLTAADYDQQAQQYHMYVQWVADRQLQAVAEQAKGAGVKLYLDVPLGVHSDSYDVWRERELFVRGVAAGAPPDTFFIQGQNWGFPPVHPEAVRSQGYRYIIACLRHQLKYTGLLRLDHIMGLHRLFWIPHGVAAHHGIYVHYPAEEMYAIVNLESHKYQVSIVGENLGIVPRYVNTTMDRHRLKRMYILPFEIRPEWHAALRPVADNAVASLNTHDMAPFAAFCQGLDIADRVDRHLLTPEEASGEQQGRQGQLHALKHFLQQQGLLDMPDAELSALLSACLAFLSASEAQVVLVNLEDLWLDTQQQNYPGTVHERPNWQQKARYGLDVFRHMPQVLALLRSINYLRKQGNVPG